MIRASHSRDGNRQAANALFSSKDSRSELAKRELAEGVAAKDANTARLRALRLEKEQREAQAATGASPIAPGAGASHGEPKKKAIRRIVCT